MPRIAKVVVDVALDREFDYLVPEPLQEVLRVGTPVRVPFGRRTVRGMVVGFASHSDHPGLKAIEARITDDALVDEKLIELARWMADYYAAPLEKAVGVVLPAVVRRRGVAFKEERWASATALARDAAARARLLGPRAARQAAVLQRLLEGGDQPLAALTRAAGATAGAVRALEQKGLLTLAQRTRRRDPLGALSILRAPPLALMPQQAEALTLVRQAIETRQPPVVLLYGVTGSGKTEVYLQAIQHARARGQGAIVLVPEIALTPQTVERFVARFGEEVAVQHSSLSEGERHDEWHRVRRGQAPIVVGARSAVFAPVPRLGLIVVDEEHEPTYKQEEAPRYHARDTAVMRGRMEGCAVVLGSATPSLESYHNAQRGKYGLACLPHRVDHRTMPDMRIVDMRVEAEREGRPTVFSGALIDAIRARLERTEQTLLFLNRRGWATALVCPRCGYVAQCEQCSVSMTYHKQRDALVCHTCGAVRKVPARCPRETCRDPAFRYAGVGTQRVEQIVARIFPQAHVQRMDSDTTTARDAHQRILGDFRTGKIDILVGTQMIAKGLHFPNVTLVGVINADTTLHMPDFRAGERTFQLLTQVAGRAGRGEVSGEVIVQTSTPFHPAIQAARALNYEAFFDQEIEFRRELAYPPCGRLVCLALRGKVEEEVVGAGEALVRELQPQLPAAVRLGGPAPAPLARAKGEYRYQVLLRGPSTPLITRPLRAALKTFKWPAGVAWSVDVDALSLL